MLDTAVDDAGLGIHAIKSTRSDKAGGRAAAKAATEMARMERMRILGAWVCVSVCVVFDGSYS